MGSVPGALVTAYASVGDLAARIAWSELAEAAAPDSPAVTGELLAAVDSGADVSEYSSDDIAAATRAYARLARALTDASAQIDGYLAGRYGALAEPVPEVVRTHTVDIAAYRLLGGDAESERYQVWRRAADWLVAVAAGRIDLYPPAVATGDVRYTSRPSAFGRDAIRGL